VNRRVIRSSSVDVHSAGFMHNTPFDQPNGISTKAHLKLMSAANASTQSEVAFGENPMPPLTGSACSLWTHFQKRDRSGNVRVYALKKC